MFAATVRTGAIRCACPADGASDAEVSAFLVASLGAEPASLLQAIRALGWQWGVVRDLVAEELMVKSRELCACEAWTRVPIHFGSAGRLSDSRAPRAQAVSLLPSQIWGVGALLARSMRIKEPWLRALGLRQQNATLRKENKSLRSRNSNLLLVNDALRQELATVRAELSAARNSLSAQGTAQNADDATHTRDAGSNRSRNAQYCQRYQNRVKADPFLDALAKAKRRANDKRHKLRPRVAHAQHAIHSLTVKGEKDAVLLSTGAKKISIPDAIMSGAKVDVEDCAAELRKWSSWKYFLLSVMSDQDVADTALLNGYARAPLQPHDEFSRPKFAEWVKSRIDRGEAVRLSTSTPIYVHNKQRIFGCFVPASLVATSSVKSTHPWLVSHIRIQPSKWKTGSTVKRVRLTEQFDYCALGASGRGWCTVVDAANTTWPLRQPNTRAMGRDGEWAVLQVVERDVGCVRISNQTRDFRQRR